jgi:outer membrane receptor protein involved in Fe transport
MKKLAGLLLLLIAFTSSFLAQESVKGVVVSQNKKGNLEPIPFANVYWMNSNYGTTTDSNGTFQLAVPDNPTKVVASFVGFVADTQMVNNYNKPVSFELKKSVDLKAVDVVYRRKSTEISFINPMKMENISERELFKAACCNLSESFETNPSVDVNFTDAVTGAKQIRMLGLDGPYTLISRENMPGVRGLGNAYGLAFIPGTWINSIQVTKGVGSVVNGYESIAGQINTELQKPEEGEQLFFNLFANQAGRMELNFVNTHQVSEKWGTTLLLHGNMRQWERDMNDDGFRDFPLQDQINVMNRWKYRGEQGIMAQFGFHYLNDNKDGGQTDEKESEEAAIYSDFTPYRIGIETEKAEFFAKVGYVFPEYKYRSMGLQFSALYHDQESFYGNRSYDATEQTAYANYIYQSILGNTLHKFKAGFSFLYDEYDEQVDSLRFDRIEKVPGAFFEYTYEPSSVFTLVAGIRADQHNLFGTFFTPRLHLRWAMDEQTVFRVLGGSGQRTANIYAERQSLLASSRSIELLGNKNLPYGLQAERAWNVGFNVTRDFRLGYRDGYISLDLYRTEFSQQAVLDLDESSGRALFYNLEGKSFSNSAQLELSYELVKFLDMRLAYRWLEVRTQYLSGERQKPLTPKHRLFANLAYETRKNLKGANWSFDLTAQWVGEQRIPKTDDNPKSLQRDEYAPSFALANVQMTRNFNKRWAVYAGMENIFNFRQNQPIIDAENPFGNNFDASLVWGPIFGRMVYGGLRFRIQEEKK